MATILAPGEPDPVRVSHPDGASPFFITCDHAGRVVPRSLGTLGLVAPGFAPGPGLTTPDPVSLSATLAALARAGVQHAAIEASSHGLDQFRLDGVRLAAAAFTNLTRDHLDYHGSMDGYRAAKLRS